MNDVLDSQKISSEVKGGTELEKTMNSFADAKEIYITVTGGFHTQGISKLLSEKGITNIVITPNVTGDTKVAEETYYKIAQEQSKIAFQALATLIPSLAIGEGDVNTLQPIFQDIVSAILSENKKLSDINAIFEGISEDGILSYDEARSEILFSVKNTNKSFRFGIDSKGIVSSAVASDQSTGKSVQSTNLFVRAMTALKVSLQISKFIMPVVLIASGATILLVTGMMGTIPMVVAITAGIMINKRIKAAINSKIKQTKQEQDFSKDLLENLIFESDEENVDNIIDRIGNVLPKDIAEKFVSIAKADTTLAKGTIANFDGQFVHLNIDILSKLFDSNGIKEGKASFLETLIRHELRHVDFAQKHQFVHKALPWLEEIIVSKGDYADYLSIGARNIVGEEAKARDINAARRVLPTFTDVEKNSLSEQEKSFLNKAQNVLADKTAGSNLQFTDKMIIAIYHFMKYKYKEGLDEGRLIETLQFATSIANPASSAAANIPNSKFQEANTGLGKTLGYSFAYLLKMMSFDAIDNHTILFTTLTENLLDEGLTETVKFLNYGEILNILGRDSKNPVNIGYVDSNHSGYLYSFEKGPDASKDKAVKGKLQDKASIYKQAAIIGGKIETFAWDSMRDSLGLSTTITQKTVQNRHFVGDEIDQIIQNNRFAISGEAVHNWQEIQEAQKDALALANSLKEGRHFSKDGKSVILHLLNLEASKEYRQAYENAKVKYNQLSKPQWNMILKDALTAKSFEEGKDFIIEDGQVIILEENKEKSASGKDSEGNIIKGKQWSGYLSAAVEMYLESTKQYDFKGKYTPANMSLSTNVLTEFLNRNFGDLAGGTGTILTALNWFAKRGYNVQLSDATMGADPLFSSAFAFEDNLSKYREVAKDAIKVFFGYRTAGNKAVASSEIFVSNINDVNLLSALIVVEMINSKKIYGSNKEFRDKIDSFKQAKPEEMMAKAKELIDFIKATDTSWSRTIKGYLPTLALSDADLADSVKVGEVLKVAGGISLDGKIKNLSPSIVICTDIAGTGAEIKPNGTTVKWVDVFIASYSKSYAHEQQKASRSARHITESGDKLGTVRLYCSNEDILNDMTDDNLSLYKDQLAQSLKTANKTMSLTEEEIDAIVNQRIKHFKVTPPKQIIASMKEDLRKGNNLLNNNVTVNENSLGMSRLNRDDNSYLRLFDLIRTKIADQEMSAQLALDKNNLEANPVRQYEPLLKEYSDAISAFESVLGRKISDKELETIGEIQKGLVIKQIEKRIEKLIILQKTLNSKDAKDSVKLNSIKKELEVLNNYKESVIKSADLKYGKGFLQAEVSKIITDDLAIRTTAFENATHYLQLEDDNVVGSNYKPIDSQADMRKEFYRVFAGVETSIKDEINKFFRHTIAEAKISTEKEILSSKITESKSVKIRKILAKGQHIFSKFAPIYVPLALIGIGSLAATVVTFLGVSTGILFAVGGVALVGLLIYAGYQKITYSDSILASVNDQGRYSVAEQDLMATGDYNKYGKKSLTGLMYQIAGSLNNFGVYASIGALLIGAVMTIAAIPAGAFVVLTGVVFASGSIISSIILKNKNKDIINKINDKDISVSSNKTSAVVRVEKFFAGLAVGAIALLVGSLAGSIIIPIVAIPIIAGIYFYTQYVMPAKKNVDVELTYKVNTKKIFSNLKLKEMVSPLIGLITAAGLAYAIFSVFSLLGGLSVVLGVSVGLLAPAAVLFAGIGMLVLFFGIKYISTKTKAASFYDDIEKTSTTKKVARSAFSTVIVAPTILMFAFSAIGFICGNIIVGLILAAGVSTLILAGRSGNKNIRNISETLATAISMFAGIMMTSRANTSPDIAMVSKVQDAVQEMFVGQVAYAAGLTEEEQAEEAAKAEEAA
ncbi:MAG: hypothetical protein PHY39_06820, partial [Endomicrobiaceae bacterium]|nr:hypothetical protein [Endomicrobiaceae bacterium]